MSNKFGLIAYDELEYANIGDYVQSIAAKQYLPKVDSLINRDKMNLYDEDNVKMIMNGWYMGNAENWPPSDLIDPLFVSIHINSTVKEALTSPQSIAYFKKHEPIGCRDVYTMNLLKAKGVEAYFSGCLTLTLAKTYKRETVSDEILIIDPLFHCLTIKEMIVNPKKMAKRIVTGRVGEYNLRSKILKEFFTKELLEQAIHIPQMTSTIGIEDSFSKANQFLLRLSRAKLVITSRIHTALPCLAMGTPVIFLNGGFSNEMNNCRFEGLIDFFHTIDVDKKGKGKASFEMENKIGVDFKLKNKQLHLPFAESIKNRCEDFIKN